jgi:carotenoid cleavage dioxygenase-like enzyme
LHDFAVTRKHLVWWRLVWFLGLDRWL